MEGAAKKIKLSKKVLKAAFKNKEQEKDQIILYYVNDHQPGFCAA